MITGELKRQVDKIWDTLWTAGITSPVTVMEQITYLLFMKLLDDSQLARESNANAFGTAVQDPVFKDGVCVISEQPRIECEYERLRWSRFSNANPPEMFETVRNYVFEFIKRLGGDEDDTAFGRYMKNAVFLIPTPEVLVSVVDDMSGMQLTDKDTMGDVYEEIQVETEGSAEEDGGGWRERTVPHAKAHRRHDRCADASDARRPDRRPRDGFCRIPCLRRAVHHPYVRQGTLQAEE